MTKVIFGDVKRPLPCILLHIVIGLTVAKEYIINVRRVHIGIPVAPVPVTVLAARGPEIHNGNTPITTTETRYDNGKMEAGILGRENPVKSGIWIETVIENTHGRGQMKATTLGTKELVQGMEGTATTENVPVMA